MVRFSLAKKVSDAKRFLGNSGADAVIGRAGEKQVRIACSVHPPWPSEIFGNHVHGLLDCERRGECYRSCKETRDFFGVPFVPGEIGTGPFGIVNTVPDVLKSNDAVIVYGHGVFTTWREDFNKPYKKMKELEASCMKEYSHRAGALS